VRCGRLPSIALLSLPDSLYRLSSLAERLARLPGVPEPVDLVADGGSPGKEGSAPTRPTPRAAVAAILRDVGPEREAEVLLIRRAEHPHDPWSGHMAFPGGRRDDADASILATALRETREEVGLDLTEHGTLLARLPDIFAPARSRRDALVISPFVFALHHEAPIAFDPDEVAEVIWTPVGPLARDECAGTIDYTWEGKTLTFPCWNLDQRVVWGLTYRMLTMLFEAAAGG
jgi:8-oxo-dGTP pyrophosphatase MutT (NUDIX family)